MRREPRKSYNEQIIYSMPVWFVRFKIDWNDQFTSIIMFFSSFVSNRLQSLDLLRVCCNAVRASERTHDPSNEWAKKLNTSRATVLRAHNVINAYVHLLIFILSSDTHPFYCTALHWAFDEFARCLFFSFRISWNKATPTPTKAIKTHEITSGACITLFGHFYGLGTVHSVHTQLVPFVIVAASAIRRRCCCVVVTRFLLLAVR